MIDPGAVLAYHFPDLPVQVTEHDAILYALGIGFGSDPVAPAHLAYTYEDGLMAFPTMPVVLGSPGMWFRDPGLGIAAARVVHAEQALTVHRPLRVGEPLVARNTVASLVDKGEGRGALLSVERTIASEVAEPVATILSTYFLRGDGGFGGDPGSAARPAPMPVTPPDRQVDIPTLPQAALIYRLSGDRNPLHADPEFARRAGLDRPILHGLCTFALAARALLQAGGTLGSLRARMSAPVIPGETIRVSIWHEPGGALRFEASVPARDVIVLTQGEAKLTASFGDT